MGKKRASEVQYGRAILQRKKIGVHNGYLEQNKKINKVNLNLNILKLPWLKQRSKYSHIAAIRLHEEICDFYDYISPTVKEYKIRVNAIKRLKKLMKEIYPHAVLKVFGSFKTGLYLPFSDIDVVMVGKWKIIPLETVKRKLISSNIAKSQEIKILANASIPIIKFREKETNLTIDISFNTINGIESAIFIKKFTKKYPIMNPIILIIKLFLYIRGLNEVYYGGLGSYALSLMVINFIQSHHRLLADIELCEQNDGVLPSSQTSQKRLSEKMPINLGVVLIEFLEHFGHNFNYEETGIRVVPYENALNNPDAVVRNTIVSIHELKNGVLVNGDSRSDTNINQDSKSNSKLLSKDELMKNIVKENHYYFPKERYVLYMSKYGSANLLCIQDPLNPANDVGRTSFRFETVRDAFSMAYVYLTRAVLNLEHAVIDYHGVEFEKDKVCNMEHIFTKYHDASLKLLSRAKFMRANIPILNKAESIENLVRNPIQPTTSQVVRYNKGRQYVLSPTIIHRDEKWKQVDDRVQNSILGLIIHIPIEIAGYRKWINAYFNDDGTLKRENTQEL